MNNVPDTNRATPPPQEENIQFYFRQHWIRLIPRAIRTFLISLVLLTMGAVLFLGTGVPDDNMRHTIQFLLAFFFLLVHLEFLEQVYNHALYVIVVSDRRIHRIKRTLFVTDDQQSIDLWMLQDIDKAQHGLLQNWLGFGTLVLEAQDSTLRIHFVPDIHGKYRELMMLREQVRQHPDRGNAKAKIL